MSTAAAKHKQGRIGVITFVPLLELLLSSLDRSEVVDSVKQSSYLLECCWEEINCMQVTCNATQCTMCFHSTWSWWETRTLRKSWMSWKVHLSSPFSWSSWEPLELHLERKPVASHWPSRHLVSCGGSPQPWPWFCIVSCIDSEMILCISLLSPYTLRSILYIYITVVSSLYNSLVSSYPPRSIFCKLSRFTIQHKIKNFSSILKITDQALEGHRIVQVFNPAQVLCDALALQDKQWRVGHREAQPTTLCIRKHFTGFLTVCLLGQLKF